MYAIREVIVVANGHRMGQHYIGLAGEHTVETNHRHAERFPTIEAARVVYRRLVNPSRWLIVAAEEDRK